MIWGGPPLFLEGHPTNIQTVGSSKQQKLPAAVPSFVGVQALNIQNISKLWSSSDRWVALQK